MDTERRQQLELAFALHYALQIAAADGVESYEEFSLLGQIFPRNLLRDAGFLGEDGHLTTRFGEYRDMALNVLRTELGEVDKKELFQVLFAAAAVDELAAEETALLEQAGSALGLAEGTVLTWIGELSAP